MTLTYKLTSEPVNDGIIYAIKTQFLGITIWHDIYLHPENAKRRLKEYERQKANKARARLDKQSG